MDKEKFERFLEELHQLEDKHGIHIEAGYEEVLDYNWDEEPYVSGVTACLMFTDKDGNEINFD